MVQVKWTSGLSEISRSLLIIIRASGFKLLISLLLYCWWSCLISVSLERFGSTHISCYCVLENAGRGGEFPMWCRFIFYRKYLHIRYLLGESLLLTLRRRWFFIMVVDLKLLLWKLCNHWMAFNIMSNAYTRTTYISKYHVHFLCSYLLIWFGR